VSDLLLLLGGLVALVIGGGLLVRGAVSAAQALGISPLVIGLTLVGFGTSTPELVTSLEAALAGSPGIALGNVVGSNISNVFLILGLSALLRPVIVHPTALKRDGSVLVLATLLCLATVLLGELSRPAGAILVAALLTYLAATLYLERRGATPASEVYSGEAALVAPASTSFASSLGLAIVGLAITIVGAKLLVAGAIALAQAAGLSETVIGLTIVAVGTSMPELVTSIVAVRKGQGDVAFGNVIGSNIFNILGILGVTAVVQPLVVPREIIALDIWILVLSTLVLLLFARTGWRIGRREGAVMVALYLAYVAVLLSGAPGS